MDSITGSSYPDRLDLASEDGWVQCIVGSKKQFQFWFDSPFWQEISTPNRESIQAEMVSFENGLWLAPWTEELEKRADRYDDKAFKFVTKIFSEELKRALTGKGWNNERTDEKEISS